MGLGDAHAPGATPLDPDEERDLIPGHLRTQRDLNEWEANNITEALVWARKGLARTSVWDDSFVRLLHKRMFSNTWKWAGRYRSTEKNIGIDPARIGVAVIDLLRDARYWFDEKTYDRVEAAARLHHRLVYIHCFANGNGRHARLFTDLVLTKYGEAPFTWGRGDLYAESDCRSAYLAALRAADGRDFRPLIAFVSS